MKKHIFKHISNLAIREIHGVDEGYEMDCLISSEFTPSPNYAGVFEKLEKRVENYGYTLEDYYDWLHEYINLWKHPISYPPFYDIQAEAFRLGVIR